jgi:protein-L-isoaspartate(D-aspartate) O-methyltransferase
MNFGAKMEDEIAVSSSSQPGVMVPMLAQLGLEPGHNVLEIGAGTSYNAALLAHLVGETGKVMTVDLDEDIVAGALAHLAKAGFGRVEIICGDGEYRYAGQRLHPVEK